MKRLQPIAQGLAFLALLLVALALTADATAQHRPKIEIVPFIQHTDSISAVAFSPDSARVLSGSEDGTLKLWNAASGQLLRTFDGHSAQVSSVAVSPDGARVLSAGWDGKVKLWDATTGQLVRTFGDRQRVVDGVVMDAFHSTTFFPDGGRILAGSQDGTLKLWDVATSRLLRTFEGHSGSVSSVAVSPDGARVLSAGWDGKVKLWDATTGQLLRTFEGHSYSGWSVAFSPDGVQVLSSGADSTLKLWDANTGQLLRTFEGHSDAVASVAFSADGTHVLSGSGDNTIRLWDVGTGQLVRAFRGHSGTVRSIAFSPDLTRLASGSNDKTINLWDASTGTLQRTLRGQSGSVWSVVLSPDAKLLLSGAGRKVRLWDATTGQLVRTFRGHSGAVRSVAFSPDGIRVLSGSKDKTIKIWDTATGHLLHTLEGHSEAIRSVAFSPDGKHVVSASDDKTIKLWEATGGQLVRTFTGHSGSVWSVTFSPDGAKVLSGSWDATLKLWDVATGNLVGTFSAGDDVGSVAISTEGTQVLSGSRDNTIKLWNANSGQLLRTFEGHSNSVWSVTFSPDSAKVLSSSADKTIRLWDATTGQLLRTFNGHSGPVHSVTFSPDGRRVISASEDTTVRIWNSATGEMLVILFAGEEDEWLATTPMGFFVGSSNSPEMLSVVREFESYSVMQFYHHLYRPDLVEERLKGDPESKHHNAADKLGLQKILDSGPAPKLELLPHRFERNGDVVKLALRLTDVGGGIGEEVYWRVNGKTRGTITAPGLGGPSVPGNYVVMPQELRVDPSEKTEIEITAFNGAGLLATQPLRFTIDPFGVTAQERPRLFVLAIGVDKYLRNSWQLTHAAKDATTVAEALRAVGSALFSHVEVVPPLLDAAATEDGIAATFERLSKVVKPRDVFVLFIGGHGRSVAGKGWYFLPQDLNLDAQHTIEGKGIGQKKWVDWLRRIDAKKSLIILDACESGAGEFLRGAQREQEAVMAQLEHATGRNIIAATPDGKAAYEGYQGHGVLTYAILEALNKSEGAGEEPVSVYGIAAHVSRRVPDISQREFGFRQSPQPKLSDDFPLGFRRPLLAAAPMLIKVPAAPTHVTNERLTVFKEPGAKGRTSLLPHPSIVTVLAVEGGWAHIAQNGKALGYVAAGKLTKLAQEPAAPQPASTTSPAAPEPQSATPPRPKPAKKAPAAKGTDWPNTFWKN